MAMLTVRNLDEQLKLKLRLKAATDGCSMEEEVRRILRDALSPAVAATGIGSRLQQRIQRMTGGVEAELPTRSIPRPPPDFEAKRG